MLVSDIPKLLVIAENDRVHNDWWRRIVPPPYGLRVHSYPTMQIRVEGVTLMLEHLRYNRRVAFLLDTCSPEEIRAVDLKIQEAELKHGGINPRDFVILSLPEDTECPEAEKSMLLRFVQMDPDWMGIEKESPTLWERLD